MSQFLRKILHARRYYSTKKVEMSIIIKPKIWDPCANLFAEAKENKYSLVILNTPIDSSLNPRFVAGLWNQAKVKLTVDGGTKRWLTWLKMNQTEFSSTPHPDLITGDMDSLPKDIINYYKDIVNTKIVTTPDQDETDYIKALRELKTYCTENKIELDTIYVLADTVGRLDQIMANINTLYLCKNFLGSIEVFQVATTSLSWILDAGSHSINIPESLIVKREWCALIPVGTACTVTTTGLKWNLNNHKLEFGGIVSSSNTYDGSARVTIQTDSPLLWSMSISSLM